MGEWSRPGYAFAVPNGAFGRDKEQSNKVNNPRKLFFAFGGNDDISDSTLAKSSTWCVVCERWRQGEQKNVWTTTVCIPEPATVSGHWALSCPTAGIVSSSLPPSIQPQKSHKNEGYSVAVRGKTNNGDALNET